MNFELHGGDTLLVTNSAQCRIAVDAIVSYLETVPNNTNVARAMLEQARSLSAFLDGRLGDVGRHMYSAQRHLEG